MTLETKSTDKLAGTLRQAAQEVALRFEQLDTKIISLETDNQRLVGENSELREKLREFEGKASPVLPANSNSSAIRRDFKSASAGGMHNPDPSRNWRSRLIEVLTREPEKNPADAASVNWIAVLVGLFVGIFLAFRFVEPWILFLTNGAKGPITTGLSVFLGIVAIVATIAAAVKSVSWFRGGSNPNS